MGSLILNFSSRPRRTLEEMKALAKIELEKLKDTTDDDIDCNDIPAPKPGEPRKWYRVNPRTPEEWEQYYRNCPPHRQKKYEQLRQKYGPII